MRQEIISDKEFVLIAIEEMVGTVGDKFLDTFNNTVDFAITELAKMHLRDLAQSGELRGERRRGLLKEAVNDVEDLIRERVPGFNLLKKKKGLMQELQYSADEIFELTAELSESRQKKRIGNRHCLPDGNNAPYEIVEIGLTGHIEGLLARPLLDRVYIDLKYLTASYEVKGEWFPYEISIEIGRAHV